MRCSSPLGLGGTDRADAVRFREGGLGTVRCFLAMAFPLQSGFPAGEILPPLDRYVDVSRLDLERVDASTLLLTGNDRGARPGERIVDVALVIMDGSLHTLDRLLGRVARLRFPGVVNLPEG